MDYKLKKEMLKVYDTQMDLMEKISLNFEVDHKSYEIRRKKSVALVVELSEAMNDSLVFKYWKVKTDPKDSLLEELTDVFHFILEFNIIDGHLITDFMEVGVEICQAEESTLQTFFTLVENAMSMKQIQGYQTHLYLMQNFVALCNCLGFELKQVIEMYYKKNEINHKRQDSGDY